MATSSPKTASSNTARTGALEPKKAIALLAGAVLVIGAALFLATSRPQAAGQNANFSAQNPAQKLEWLHQKARELRGDFSKMEGADREKATLWLGGQAKAPTEFKRLFSQPIPVAPVRVTSGDTPVIPKPAPTYDGRPVSELN